MTSAQQRAEIQLQICKTAKDNREKNDTTVLNSELKTTVVEIDLPRMNIDTIVAEIEK